jgi:hypothetical protein
VHSHWYVNVSPGAMNPPARVNSPMYAPSYSGLYLTPCGCIVTAWRSLRSPLRKCTTSTSPTSPTSVGPGRFGACTYSAKPGVISRYMNAR